MLVGSAALLLGFGVVLSVYVRGGELLPGELGATSWFAGIDSPPVLWSSEFLDAISEFEVAPFVFAVLLPVVLLLWGLRALLLFALAGSLTAVTAVANIADRARPTEDLRFVQIVSDAGGYPSGHVVYGVLVFGTIAYLAFKHMRPGRARSIVTAVMVAIAVLMGPSRVVELDHWPADVVGSYLLSVPFLLGLIWLDRHPQMSPGGTVHSQALSVKSALKTRMLK